MPTKSKRRPKLTDAERHKLFVDMARHVHASEDLKDFDRAFKKIAGKPGRWVKTKIKIGAEGRPPKD